MNYDGRVNKTLSWNEYQRQHRWVRKSLGRANHCSIDSTHQSRRYHWSNVSGMYKWDLNDYRPLCQSCHTKIDMTPEWRYKFSKRSKGNSNAAKPIVRLGLTPVIYPSARYAAKQNNILTTSINNALKGISKKAGGHEWRYYNAI